MALTEKPPQSFVWRQVRQIRNGGSKEAMRKVRILAILPMALVVVLVVRALRPLVTIRFGVMPSLLIGPFARNVETYMCERDAGLFGRKGINIWYYKWSVSNSQLKKMWDRSIHVSQLAGILDRANLLIPGGKSHVIPWRMTLSRDTEAVRADEGPHISFIEDEESRGAEYLRQSGVPDGGRFICFHSRDSAYRYANFPGRDDDHNAFRNTSVSNYLPAAQELARRGDHAFRMGAIAAGPLPAADNKVVDYASNGRTDFLDIYLAAKCRFFLGCGSGIDGISMIFGRPTIYANYIPLKWITFSALGPNDLMIPKKLWLRQESRWLTFPEILRSDIGTFGTTQEYENSGIDVVENTPEEITAVAVEMDQRLNETWQAMNEDEELQSRFQALFEPGKTNGAYPFRIGAEFLRQNRELID